MPKSKIKHASALPSISGAKAPELQKAPASEGGLYNGAWWQPGGEEQERSHAEAYATLTGGAGSHRISRAQSWLQLIFERDFHPCANGFGLFLRRRFFVSA